MLRRGWMLVQVLVLVLLLPFACKRSEPPA